MPVDRAFTLPVSRRWPGHGARPRRANRHTHHELLVKIGAQDIEPRVWLGTRAALTSRVTKRHSSYLPIANTAAGPLRDNPARG